jgi:ferric-dicitrate binding protein FerR (iron transport regulator)
MPVILNETDRQVLEQWGRAHRTPQQVAQTIQRIWQSHHLQPHRTKNFKLLPPRLFGRSSAVRNLLLPFMCFCAIIDSGTEME